MIYRHTRGCPVCGGHLEERRTQDYSYERCGTCYGMWISLPVLRLMVASMESGAEPDFAPIGTGRRRCLDCHASMAAMSLFEIPVDVCSEHWHGVWFDKDELAQALERVGEAQPAPAEPPTSFVSLLGEFFSA